MSNCKHGVLEDKLKLKIERLKVELDYYKDLVTSDQRYDEGLMVGHQTCREMAEKELSRLQGLLDSIVEHIKMCEDAGKYSLMGSDIAAIARKGRKP